MAMPQDANKPRKGFVLKCDKPRYDGGVELNLEKYFGRRLQPNQAALRQTAASFANEAKITPQQVEALKRKAQELLASLPDGSRMTLSKPAATQLKTEPTATIATLPTPTVTQQACLNEVDPSTSAPEAATATSEEAAPSAMPPLETKYLPTHFMVCGLSLLGGMVGMSMAHCLHDPMAYHQSQHLLSQSWQAVCVVLKKSLPAPFQHAG